MEEIENEKRKPSGRMVEYNLKKDISIATVERK